MNTKLKQRIRKIHKNHRMGAINMVALMSQLIEAVVDHNVSRGKTTTKVRKQHAQFIGIEGDVYVTKEKSLFQQLEDGWRYKIQRLSGDARGYAKSAIRMLESAQNADENDRAYIKQQIDYAMDYLNGVLKVCNDSDASLRD